MKKTNVVNNSEFCFHSWINENNLQTKLIAENWIVNEIHNIREGGLFLSKYLPFKVKIKPAYVVEYMYILMWTC